MTREKYESLPLATLKELAKTRKMKGISGMKKKDLIDAMMALDEKEAREAKEEDAVKETKAGRKEGKEVHFSEKRDGESREYDGKAEEGHQERREKDSSDMEILRTEFWKFCRTDTDLFVVPIICLGMMMSMYRPPRSDVLT